MKKRSLLLSVVTAFGFTTASMAQVPNYVATNGLVGYWPFNGNANDESGNGNHGTVNGATLTSDRSGNSDNAFYFSSAGCDTRIDADVNTSSIQEAYTFSYWFLQTGQGCIGPRTFEFSTGQNASGFLQSQNWNNYHSVTFIAGTAPYSTLICPAPTNGEWTNITLTVNLTGAKLYFNGVIADSVSFNTNFLSLNGDMCMGRMNHPAYDAHEGKLDDIGIWNRALDSCEVKDLYFASLGNCCNISVTTQPINQSVNISNNAQFTTASSDPLATYQWQTDLGVGFQNLNSVGQYSGTTNDTLTIANTTLSNNNQPFRCIISSGSCTDTSNVAVLNVNNNIGINEFTQNNLFSVYPNPAKSQINVKADAKLLGSIYTVYDNVGKVVLSGKIIAENTVIELGNLTGGIYLFSVGENMKQTFKVIKE